MLILRGYTARTGVLVAAVVGTILSSVNDGAALAHGLTPVLALRVATNYAVPFVVSSIGYLAPLRRTEDLPTTEVGPEPSPVSERGV